ncbi:hypothetical protein H4R20_005139 [Coemansia guatemalensis]|uniref:Uncharacterized protein n=1 Tax=Coemansia guatemalensis TaxID=2761395 RepID=A0A9W8HTB1_9FUNG|nr:hypothetical protein H4R20_005139 [Coemansia guatemalensis]
MKLCYKSAIQVATIAALSLTCALATPDTPGTKTFVISLATTDNGQLVPVVLDRNSNGFETLSMPETSDDASVAQDTDADVQSLGSSSILEAATTDEQTEPNENADSGITETTPQEGDVVYDSDSDSEENDANDSADAAGEDGNSSSASSSFSNALTLAVALGISAIATDIMF